jgi:hypothetical protein
MPSSYYINKLLSIIKITIILVTRKAGCKGVPLHAFTPRVILSGKSNNFKIKALLGIWVYEY